MHAQSVNPLFPNVSLPVREKAVVGESAKKSEYTGQPIAPAEVRNILKVWWLDATVLCLFLKFYSAYTIHSFYYIHTEYSSVAIR
jgi:hypothetical protein